MTKRKRVAACQSLFDSPGSNKRARSLITSTPEPKSTSANDHQNGHNDDDDDEDSIVENSLNLGLEATVNESMVDATVNESTVNEQETAEHEDLFDTFNTIWTDAYTNFKRTLTDALVKDDKSKRTSKLQEHYGLLKSEKTEEKLNKGETPSEEVRTVLKDYICV